MGLAGMSIRANYGFDRYNGNMTMIFDEMETTLMFKMADMVYSEELRGLQILFMPVSHYKGTCNCQLIIKRTS